MALPVLVVILEIQVRLERSVMQVCQDHSGLWVLLGRRDLRETLVSRDNQGHPEMPAHPVYQERPVRSARPVHKVTSGHKDQLDRAAMWEQKETRDHQDLKGRRVT